MNNGARHDSFWPFGWVVALLAVPAVWILLLLVLGITERWLSWPDPASRHVVVYVGVAVSLLPLLLALVGLMVNGPAREQTRQSAALAEIERNRIAYQDMAWRAAPPNAPVPDDPTMRRFKELLEVAGKTTHGDQLDALVEEAEALGQRRAYLCPEAEIATEARSHLYSLIDWGVPSKKIDSLKEAAAPAFAAKLEPKDVPAARGALHVILEEYDTWSSYVDDYNSNTSFWASTFLIVIAVLSMGALFLMFGLSWRVLAIVLAAIVGATASVIARLPGLTSYGEWVVNLRAYQARIGTGIVGSLVGIGLIGSGLLSIGLPKEWKSADALLVTCLRACPVSQCPGEDPPPQPAVSGSTTPSEPRPVCDAGGLLFLLALTMLLGFSERLLTSLEGRVVGPGSGPAASAPTTTTTPRT